MKKLYTIVAILFALNAYSQNTTTLPTGTNPSTISVRTKGTDSLHTSWFNFPGIGWNRFYSATESNLRYAGIPTDNIKNSDSLLNTITWSGINLNAKAVAKNGYLYVCEYSNNKIAVFDISDNVNIRLVNEFSTGSNPRAIDIVNNKLIVACTFQNTLEVYDVQNPKSSLLVSTTTVGTTPKSFVIVGKYLYLVCYGTNKLEKWDISNLAAPIKITDVATGNTPLSVCYSNRLLAVVGISGTLDLYSEDDLTHSSYILPGTTSGTCEFYGNNILVTDNSRAKLVVIDINTFASPLFVTEINTSVNPEEIRIVGSRAYIPSLTASGTSGTLDCIDLTNPRAPIKYKTIALPGSGIGFSAVAGEYLYVTNHFTPFGLSVVKVSPPIYNNNKRDLGVAYFSPEYLTLNGTANQVIVSGTPSVKTLSLPQSISTSSIPTFGRMILKDVVNSNTAQLKMSDLSTSLANSYAGNFGDSFYLSIGGTYSSGWVSDNANRGIANIVLGSSNGGSTIALQTSNSNATAPTTKLTIDGLGRAGIGITPSTNAQLSVNGGPLFLGYGNTNNVAWHSAIDVFALGQGGSVSSNNNATQTLINNNSYVNASIQNIYLKTGAAQSLQLDVNGNFNFMTAPSGTAGAVATFATVAAISQAGSFNSAVTQTTVSGSTSGSIVASQPFRGSSYKKVIIYCNALSGTATYTFPTAFAIQPVMVTSGSLVSAISTTSVTVNNAATTWVIIEGY